jgi:DNA helicase II / ATP-dependent DNA helicase PcrA
VMPSPSNRAVIAAAGSGKTEYIIGRALEVPATRRVLITTYTRENCDQICERIQVANGCKPSHVSVLGWFSFLINQAARPYQSSVTGQIDFAKALNLKANRPKGIARANWRNYYFDPHCNFRPEGVSEFACRANEATGDRVIHRLEALYDEIYIDEFQDLAGYDLEFLDLLFASKIRVTVVGDPRQHTYSTNRSAKNRQYRGHAMLDWLQRRAEACKVEHRAESWRCNQPICDWADALYPELPKTSSLNLARTGHDEVVLLAQDDVPVYMEKFNPTVLRWNRTVNTLGFPAMNIGVSKGSTFDRVLIFPTKPMLTYIKSGDPAGLTAREHLYVAVTRARHSVAFVVSRKEANYIP